MILRRVTPTSNRNPGERAPYWGRGLHRAGLGLGALLLLIAGFPGHSPAATVRPERWRWSNPLPHGNNVLDMLVSGDLAVQVGDGGTVYVQLDGGRWAPALTGVTNYLRGVALMGDRILVVGEHGCILWSDDWKTFQKAQVTPATTDWFEGVAASEQRAVAVGDNGSIYTSTNGLTWTKSTSGTTEWLRGVAWGASGTFVVVGEYGTLLRGTGASAWSAVASGTTADLNRVRYLSGSATTQFIAVGSGGLALSSSTGTSGWTSLNSGTTNELNDVALNDTGTLLVGDQQLRFRAAGTSSWTNQITDLSTNAPAAWTYLSAFGATNYFLAAGRTGWLVEGLKTNGGPYAWSPLPDSSHAWLWDATVQQGIHVAVGDLATILTSLDGLLWAREVVPVPRTNTVLLGVGGTTNLLLAVGNSGTVLLSRAQTPGVDFNTLGVVWTNLPTFTTNALQGVAANSNLYVLCGEAGKIFTSTNGSNWTARVTVTTNFLSGVASAPGGWVAVGNRGTLLRSAPDATTWSSVSLGTTNWLYRVRWVGGQLVAVGQNGSIFTSPNATNWTARISGTTRWLNDVTFVEDTWFVTGNQGLLLCSSNLTTWTALPLPTIKSLYTAVNWEGQLLLSGIEGAVLRNQVTPRLTPVNFLRYARSQGTETTGAGATALTPTSAYELFLFGAEPDQFFDLQSATNLAVSAWTTNASQEIFDPSGTLYLLRVRPVTNTPPREFYRTRLVP
jgi:hypothetical protein